MGTKDWRAGFKYPRTGFRSTTSQGAADPGVHPEKAKIKRQDKG